MGEYKLSAHLLSSQGKFLGEIVLHHLGSIVARCSFDAPRLGVAFCLDDSLVFAGLGLDADCAGLCTSLSGGVRKVV